jgi:hypothetical protein
MVGFAKAPESDQLWIDAMRWAAPVRASNASNYLHSGGDAEIHAKGIRWFPDNLAFPVTTVVPVYPKPRPPCSLRRLSTTPAEEGQCSCLQATRLPAVVTLASDGQLNPSQVTSV